MAHFVPKRSHRSGNSFANSSRTCFCIPLFHFRNSGNRVAKVPEFRYVQKSRNFGIPEIGNTGIVITTYHVYKLCLITYKAIHNNTPDYITDFCISAADNRLRSSAKNLLQVQQSSSKFGDCSFSDAGPTAWNSLPDYVKNASSLETFKSRLKTHLFKHSYDCR